MSEVVAQVRGGVGLITLNRPKALNALSLAMIRSLTATLRAWRDDPDVSAIAMRGQGRDAHATEGSAPFGAFCAGGDIRFFHAAALAGDPALEDFFTEEYALNHLIHQYPKPYAVFLDGIAMGGGMGLAGHGRTGATLRIVTERTRMAMPETQIGLFPDVGGGHFLARCPGHWGEYLALTGTALGAADAIAAGLADACVPASRLPSVWDQLTTAGWAHTASTLRQDSRADGAGATLAGSSADIDRFFGLDSVGAIVAALEREASPWAADTAATLRKRSPLMLHVAFEQVRRARTMSFADELRMERGLVRRCFHLRPGAASETVEGIRALAVDKDHQPRWNPARIEDVTPDQVLAFFDSPWPAAAHPLHDLA